VADEVLAKGSNELISSTLFIWRRYYDDFAYPIEKDKPVPMDFRNQKMTYGRVNQERDWIYIVPKEEYFRDLPTSMPGKTVQVLNFVADAFEEFQVAIRNRVSTGKMATAERSLFSDITAEYGYVNPQTIYNQYLNTLYQHFVVGFLETGNYALGSSIMSFKGFMAVFLKWAARRVSSLQFTRTGYLSSNHISPRISGLCIETHDADFSQDYTKHSSFIQDPNFEAYRTLALKYGFRIDRHAPWRLVADVASSYMQTKMFKYGLSKDNLFYTYFVPSYKYDIDMMRVVLYNWYNQYVTTYPQVKIVKTEACKSHVFGDSVDKHFIVAKYLDRKRFSSSEEYDNNFGPLYWLRQYLYIRSKEVSMNMSDFRFKQKVKKAHNLYLSKDFDAAVSYINNNIKKYQPNIIVKQPALGAVVNPSAIGNNGKGGSY